MDLLSTTLQLISLALLVGYIILREIERHRLKSKEFIFQTNFEKIQKQTHQQRAALDNLLSLLVEIHEFDITAMGSPSKVELGDAIMGAACRLMRSNNGSLMLLNPQTNELAIIASRGLSDNVANTAKLKVGEGIAGRVAKTGKQLFVDNIETDIRFLKTSDARYPSKSFISVPLKSKDRIIGVLNISPGKDGVHFEESDIHLITILSDVAAMTIENLTLYTNLRQFYMDMVETISRMIDAKDAYTQEHAGRARKYTKLIAEKLNLPKEMVQYIEYAALMHDIGKIGIDDNILRKPGKLTSDEVRIIRSHPVIGNRIISPVTFLNPIAPMVLYHQEWYNGRGYPEGLKAEEIPLGARVVAVIDAYDAMTSDRPYRKAMSKEFVLNELRRGAGFQFDPKVVETFIEILESEEFANIRK